MNTKQEEALREYLKEAIVPLIEQVLVKKLGQAMSFAASELVQPQRTWVGLTDDEIMDAYDVAKVSFKRSQQGIRGQMLTSRDSPDWHYAKAIEAKLKEKNT